MSDTKKDDNLAPIAAGVAGAIIGAGVAVAANKIMSDDKLRHNLKTQASKFGKQLKTSMDNMREAAAQQLEAKVVEPAETAAKKKA